MKKLIIMFLGMFHVGMVWAIPTLEFRAFKGAEPVLGTIKVVKGTNAYYKMDLYLTITDGSLEYKSHIDSKSAYHPFLDKTYIVSRLNPAPMGAIVKAEAQLIIQSCLTKEFQSCSVVKQEYLNLDIADNKIVGIIPNQIDVTL